VKICLTFCHFPSSGQPNGLSRARCSCAIAVLVRRLSCRLPRRSAAMGLQIDKKAEAVRSQGDLGRLAKNRRSCGRRELGPGQDPRNILETVERVTGKRTDSPTVAEWFERWIRTGKGAVAARTMMRYEQIVRDFLSRGDWRSRTTHAGLRAEVASLVSKGTDHHAECHHSRII
jgi:hypothetical protein